MQDFAARCNSLAKSLVAAHDARLGREDVATWTQQASELLAAVRAAGGCGLEGQFAELAAAAHVAFGELLLGAPSRAAAVLLPPLERLAIDRGARAGRDAHPGRHRQPAVDLLLQLLVDVGSVGRAECAPAGGHGGGPTAHGDAAIVQLATLMAVVWLGRAATAACGQRLLRAALDVPVPEGRRAAPAATSFADGHRAATAATAADVVGCDCAFAPAPSPPAAAAAACSTPAAMPAAWLRASVPLLLLSGCRGSGDAAAEARRWRMRGRALLWLLRSLSSSLSPPSSCGCSSAGQLLDSARGCFERAAAPAAADGACVEAAAGRPWSALQLLADAVEQSTPEAHAGGGR
eukprot:TRINITY_DN333_c1_g1_i2.p2 TRINITY_DN333_c1_g1~~TRINITY_DN333_c1_g1_i2.p2  ORF type:complete len:349 (-),score=91.03 TRINITY_DN333_c1_g1_i2:1390-2436(-)